MCSAHRVRQVKNLVRQLKIRQIVRQMALTRSPMSRCQGGDYIGFRDYLDAGYFYLRNPDTNLVDGINLAVISDNVEAQSHTEGYNQECFHFQFISIR